MAETERSTEEVLPDIKITEQDEGIKKKKEKPAPKKLRPGSGGCVGCIAGIISTFICTICLVVFGGFFLLDRFLIVNYEMSVNDCFTLISSIDSVNEKKVITEGKATEEDRDEFYSTLADSLFLKDETVSSLVDTAIDELVVPAVTDALSGKDQGVSTAPAHFGDGQDEQGFDWQAFLKKLLDDGVIDKDKIEAYFNNEASAEEKYNDYFVLELKGKGMVSTVDYALNRILSANPDTAKLAHTFGIGQLKFTSTEENGKQFKQINVVLDVKLRSALTNLISSPLFSKFVTDESILQNKDIIKQLVSMLPVRLLLSIDLNVADEVTVDFRINNLSDKQVDKWLKFAKDIAGIDLESMINEMASTYYTEIRNSIIKYVDIEKLIGNGSLDVDMFEIVSVVLNEQMGLEGENALSKVEVSTTVSNVLYANMDVNGNGIESVIEQDAPSFATDNWKEEAETAFIDWLATNIAFDKNHTLDEVVAQFKDETGKLAVPSQFTSLLEFIDTEYLRKGTAFLKQGIKFDDRFVAYLFEDYKQDVFEMAGYGKLAPVLHLQYVSITEEEIDGEKHNYLSLGLSADTKAMCEALGYGEFDFISSFVGEEVFLCAIADVTLNNTIERKPTELKINGLSPKQTLDILETVKKLTGYDVMGDLVDKNLDKFIDQFVTMTNNKYAIGFEVRTNADGSTTGMVILPSVTEILQQIFADNGNDIDVEALVDAVDSFLKSSPSNDNYLSSLADTSIALTGKADSFESYDDVVSKMLFDKYFLDSNSNLEEVLALILKVVNQEDGAMDELLGTDEKVGLIKINSAYFATNASVESTRPVLDGHTLAYVINNAKGILNDLLGDDVARFVELVDVRDIKIEGGYLAVTVASSPSKLLSIEEMDVLDSFVKNFIYSIFGGENADITVTVKVNVADNAEKIKISVQDMTEEEMQSIFDLLKTFGITVFDFSDENNQFVALADQLAGYIKQYATIEGNTATLPSVFGLINQLVGSDQLSEEALYGAVRSLMVSEADTSDYNDVLADANEILTGSAESNYTYSQLVSKYAEQKYVIKQGKNIGDVLAIVGEGGDSMVENLIDEENGVIELSRQSLSNYFTSVAPTLDSANPVLDSHSLAYIIDTYKDQLASLMGLDANTAEILALVKVADATVNDNVLTVRIVLNVEQLAQKFVVDSEFPVSKLFNILEDGTEVLSASLSVSLEDDDRVKLIINDMTDAEISDINTLLKAFGIGYFDMADPNNPLLSVIKEVKVLIGQYMPYDSVENVFKMSSIFDFIAQYVDFDGQKITANDGYTLIRSLVTYDDGAVVEEDHSAVDYEANLNALTSRYYAIDNGTELIEKAQSGEISVNDVEINAETIKNGSGDYKKSFVYGKENIIPFIMGLGIDLGNQGFILNRVNVLDTNVISVNIIIEVSSLVGEGLEMFASVLPSRMSVTVPISFASSDHGDWQIDGMDGFEQVKQIFKIVGMDLDATVNDARDSMVGDGSIKQILDDFGIAFVCGENEGIKFPSLPSLYTKIDNTFTEDEVIVLIDNVVCYDESNVVYGENYDDEYESAFNALALDHYAIDNGISLIDSALNGSVDLDSIEIKKDRLKSGKYKSSFVYEDKYLVSFINGLGMMPVGDGLVLNTVAVNANNEITVNVIAETANLMSGTDVGAFETLLPSALSVTIPVNFNTSADQGDWQIDGMGQLAKVIEILKKLGVDVSDVIDEQRNNIISTVGDTFSEYGISFVGGEDAGLEMPSLAQLYGKVDGTFTEDEVIVLIDNVVCYDESNVVYGENYDDEYESAFNALALDHYAIDNGISLIDSALNGSVDLDSIEIKKDRLKSGKYKSSFVYEDKYLVSFINGLGMMPVGDGLVLNTVAVNANNEITVNVIAETANLMSGTDVGAFETLLPSALSVTIPVNFNTSADQGDWQIDGMGQLAKVIEILKKLGVDVSDVIDEQRNNIISTVGDTFSEYGISFVGGEDAGLEMPSLAQLYGKVDGTFTEDDVIVLIEEVVLNTTEVVINDYSSSPYKTEFDNLIQRYYAMYNGYDVIRKVMDGEMDKNGLTIDADLIRANGKYKNYFMYDDCYLVPFVNDMGISMEESGTILNSISVLNTDVVTVNAVLETAEMLDGVEIGSFASLLPDYLSVNIPVNFATSEQSSWSMDGVSNLSELTRVLSVLGVDVETLIEEQRDNIISEVNGAFSQYGIKFDVAQFEEGNVAGLKMPALVDLYSEVDDTLSRDELALLIDEIVCYDTDNVQEKDYTQSEYKEELERDILKHYAMKDGFTVMKNLTASTLDMNVVAFDKNYFNAERNYVKNFVYAERNLVPFLTEMNLSISADGYKLNYINVTGANKIEVEVIVDVSAIIGSGDEMGAMSALMPQKLAIVIPVDIGQDKNGDHGEWYIKGVDDTASVVATVNKLASVDLDAQVKEQRADLLTGETSVKGVLDSYGMSFVGGESAGLEMPKFTQLYGFVDDGNQFTESEVTCLIDNLVRYDEDSFVVEENNTEFKNTLNSITKQHYAINDGYDTISHLVNGVGFSIDSLEFDVEIFRDGDRDYVNSFIYEDSYLASFIKDVGLIDQDGGFILNRIDVTEKNKIEVNLIVEIASVGEADFGIMESLLPTRLSITVPISFNSSVHGDWTIDGMGEQDEVVGILNEKMGVDLGSLITDQRNTFIESSAENLTAHGMGFDVKDGKAGLLLPSVCALYAKEKDGFSEQDAIYLFDNLVCYQEIEHSIFTESYTKEDAKNEFMDIMAKYYHIKQAYSGSAKHVDKTGNYTNVQLTDEPVTYEMLLASFGFAIDGYEGYLVETKELMDIDDVLSLLLNESAIADLTTDVLIRNEIITLWIESIGSVEGFDLEKIKVIDNGKISFTGFISMSDHLGDGVCKTAKSLMCDKLNVTMQIDLGTGALINYYIEDLVGDVDGNFAGEENDYEKTQKLISIMQRLDASLNVSDATFASYACDIALTVNNMLNVINGIDPFMAQEGDNTVQTAKAVYYGEGEIPTELEVFGTNCGFLLPDGASYAYRNCSDFRTMFDTYYPYM